MKQMKRKLLTRFTSRAKTVTELKRRAISLMRKGWCIKFLAISLRNDPVDECGENVAKVCALGAILRSNPTRRARASLETSLNMLAIKAHFNSYIQFNNAQKSAAPVIKLFQKA